MKRLQPFPLLTLLLLLALPLRAQPVTHMQPDIRVSTTGLALHIGACTFPDWVEDSLTVFNLGTTAVDVQNITTAGDGIFTIVSPVPSAIPFTLQPGGSRTVRVRYTAAEAGESTGSLDFTTTDPNNRTFEVELRGEHDSIIIVPTKKKLILPQIFSCSQTSKGKLWLKNAGAATATLDAVYINSPFSFIPPGKTPIRPGDSVAVDLTFAPIADGLYSEWLIYEISPCGIRDSVLVTAERASARYDIADVDFGNVLVGGSMTGSATVTNRNSVGVWLTGGRIAPPNAGITIDPGQFPQLLPAGATVGIGLRFTPTAIGAIPADTKLLLTADSTCPSTLEAAIRGTGVAGGIEVAPSSLQFGGLLACRDTSDTLFIRNIGTAPLFVRRAEITPQSAKQSFTILRLPDPATPIPPGAGDTIVIRFLPGAGPDTAIVGLLTIYSSDPINPPMTVSLSGARISQHLALAGGALTAVETGQSESFTRWIVNTGSAPIAIDRLSVGAPFAIDGSRAPLPATLAPGDSLEVTVAFAPRVAGNYADSIAIGSPQFCDSIFLPVTATGFDIQITHGLAAWGRAAGAPGKSVRIPLLLNNDLAGAAVTGYTASARFDPSLLVPRRIVLEGTLSAGWSVTSQSFSAGGTSFSATGATPLSGVGVLAFLEADVMLGDSISTPVTAGDTAGTDSRRATLSISPGLFTLNGYCVAGGSGRLIRITDGFGLKSVSPNPVTATAQIEFQTTEQGPTQLALFDRLGREAARLVDAELSPRSYIVTLRGTDFPSGVYYLELRTPTQRERREVIILR